MDQGNIQADAVLIIAFLVLSLMIYKNKKKRKENKKIHLYFNGPAVKMQPKFPHLQFISIMCKQRLRLNYGLIKFSEQNGSKPYILLTVPRPPKKPYLFIKQVTVIPLNFIKSSSNKTCLINLLTVVVK